jgi:hypothetical protein
MLIFFLVKIFYQNYLREKFGRLNFFDYILSWQIIMLFHGIDQNIL